MNPPGFDTLIHVHVDLPGQYLVAAAEIEPFQNRVHRAFRASLGTRNAPHRIAPNLNIGEKRAPRERMPP
jgi:hypothetical protein